MSIPNTSNRIAELIMFGDDFNASMLPLVNRLDRLASVVEVTLDEARPSPPIAGDTKISEVPQRLIPRLLYQHEQRQNNLRQINERLAHLESLLLSDGPNPGTASAYRG